MFGHSVTVQQECIFL